MDLLIPPWVRISGGRYDFLSNTAAFPSTFTGSIRSTDRLGDRVGVSITTQNASHEEVRPTRAFLSALRARMRGQSGRIWYTDSGYTPRGSFPATELLSNNTFANGTTGWTSSGETTLSVSDRAVRALRTAVTANQYALRGSSVVSGLSQYAPYVARFMVMQGRGSYSSGFGIDNAGSFSGTVSAGFGLKTQVLVTSGTTLDPAFLDASTSGLLAGDYIQIPYSSLSRCALVDGGGNYMLRSDELQTTWSPTGLAVSANAHNGPDGAGTADRLTEDSSSGFHFLQQSYTRVATAEDWCAYAYAKRITGTRNFSLDLGDGTGTATCTFDLGAGTAGAVSTAGGVTNGRAFIRSMGNGFYLCFVVARLQSTTTARTQMLMTSGSSLSYAGDGASSLAVSVAGANRSSFPSRPTQTTSAVVAASSQTGPGYYTKGWPASTNGLLLQDDWVQIGNQLNKVVAPVNSDAAGRAYLQLAYPFRTAPSDNDPVIIHEPFGRFVSVSNEGGYDFMPDGSNHELTLVEDLTA